MADWLRLKLGRNPRPQDGQSALYLDQDGVLTLRDEDGNDTEVGAGNGGSQAFERIRTTLTYDDADVWAGNKVVASLEPGDIVLDIHLRVISDLQGSGWTTALIDFNYGNEGGFWGEATSNVLVDWCDSNNLETVGTDMDFVTSDTASPLSLSAAAGYNGHSRQSLFPRTAGDLICAPLNSGLAEDLISGELEVIVFVVRAA